VGHRSYKVYRIAAPLNQSIGYTHAKLPTTGARSDQYVLLVLQSPPHRRELHDDWLQGLGTMGMSQDTAVAPVAVWQRTKLTIRTTTVAPHKQNVRNECVFGHRSFYTLSLLWPTAFSHWLEQLSSAGQCKLSIVVEEATTNTHIRTHALTHVDIARVPFSCLRIGTEVGFTYESVFCLLLYPLGETSLSKHYAFTSVFTVACVLEVIVLKNAQTTIVTGRQDNYIEGFNQAMLFIGNRITLSHWRLKACCSFDHVPLL